MGYAMTASHLALPCEGAAAKVPQVARPASILRHCGTCATPYVEERLVQWRSPSVARDTRRRTRGWRLRLAAMRSPSIACGPHGGSHRNNSTPHKAKIGGSDRRTDGSTGGRRIF